MCFCRSDGVMLSPMHVLSSGHSDARVGRSPENMFVGKRTSGVSASGLALMLFGVVRVEPGLLVSYRTLDNVFRRLVFATYPRSPRVVKLFVVNRPDPRAGVGARLR